MPRKEREFLSVEESWRLLDAVKCDWYGPAIWIGLLSALRPGEIQALKWDDVDFENNRLLIRGNFCRKEKVLKPNPKQKDWGQAPIPEPLKDYLMELRQKTISQFVASGFERHEILNYDSFRKALTTACRKLGMTEISPHELRHSATELYYSAGAGTEDLKRLLNHKSAQTTQTYIHRTDERLSKIAGTINNVIPIHVSPKSESHGHIVDTFDVVKTENQ